MFLCSLVRNPHNLNKAWIFCYSKRCASHWQCSLSEHFSQIVKEAPIKCAQANFLYSRDADGFFSWPKMIFISLLTLYFGYYIWIHLKSKRFIFHYDVHISRWIYLWYIQLHSKNILASSQDFSKKKNFSSSLNFFFTGSKLWLLFNIYRW